MWGEFVNSSVLYCCNKNLKWRTDQHYSSQMDRCYSPQTDQCYSSVGQLSFIYKQRKIHSQGVMECRPKRCKEKRGPSPVSAPHCICFFVLPLGLPYVNWASQECCFFYLRSSLQSLDLPLFNFCGFSPSLSFSHCHSGRLFPILPNTSHTLSKK